MQMSYGLYSFVFRHFALQKKLASFKAIRHIQDLIFFTDGKKCTSFFFYSFQDFGSKLNVVGSFENSISDFWHLSLSKMWHGKNRWKNSRKTGKIYETTTFRCYENRMDLKFVTYITRRNAFFELFWFVLTTYKLLKFWNCLMFYFLAYTSLIM